MRYLALSILAVTLLAQAPTLPFKGAAGETILFKQGKCEEIPLSHLDNGLPVFISWWSLPPERRRYFVQTDFMRKNHYDEGTVYAVQIAGKPPQWFCRYHIANWIGIDVATGKKEAWINTGFSQ